MHVSSYWLANRTYACCRPRSLYLLAWCSVFRAIGSISFPSCFLASPRRMRRPRMLPDMPVAERRARSTCHHAASPSGLHSSSSVCSPSCYLACPTVSVAAFCAASLARSCQQVARRSLWPPKPKGCPAARLLSWVSTVRTAVHRESCCLLCILCLTLLCVRCGLVSSTPCGDSACTGSISHAGYQHSVLPRCLRQRQAPTHCVVSRPLGIAAGGAAGGVP